MEGRANCPVVLAKPANSPIPIISPGSSFLWRHISPLNEGEVFAKIARGRFGDSHRCTEKSRV